MTTTELPFDPAEIRRVEDPTGSHIEPPADSAWSPFAMLVWAARVTEIDAGMPDGTLVVVQVDDEAHRFYLRTPDRCGYPHQTHPELLHDLHSIAKGWRIARAVDARAAAGG